MSNAWVTCPCIGDNIAKAVLIPDTFPRRDLREESQLIQWKLTYRDGPASYQLVGGVTAHQGYDG